MTKTYCDWCGKALESDFDIFKLEVKTSIRYSGGTQYFDCCPECYESIKPPKVELKERVK